MSPIGEQKQHGKSNGTKQSVVIKKANNVTTTGENNYYSEEQFNAGSPHPAERLNVPSHKIFMFGTEDDDMMNIDNGSIELTEIRSRNRKDNLKVLNAGVDEEVRKSHFISHDVGPEDSLAKLALNYGCSITQLKQANNIHKEQELHARKILKIPVYEHGVLCENFGNRKNSLDSKIVELKRSHSESSLLRKARDNFMFERDTGFRNQNDSVSSDLTYSDDDDNIRQENRSLLNGRSKATKKQLNDTNNLYEEYLELVDKDIKSVSDKVQSRSGIVDIGEHSIMYMHPDGTGKKLEEKLGKAGWVNYKGILIAVCTIGVLLPIMYILYFKVFEKDRQQ